MFVSVDETRFSTGIYPAYIDLLTKFNPQNGEADPDLTVEIELFLDQLMETGPMQAAFTCMNEWGKWKIKINHGSRIDMYGF